MVAIDINCDMGESFGHYSMGRDEEVMPYITTANIAAGFHGGDPHMMNETAQLADRYNVNVGVHPGLPDLMGFGRRKMDATPEEIRDYVIYQLGALRAFADQHDITFQHVKPHGAMYSMLSESEDHVRAVIEGIRDVDENLIYLATDMNIYEAVEEYPIRTVFEGYIDMDYSPDRSLVVETHPGGRDPALVADRFITIATESRVKATNGEYIDIPAESICIHGDNPNAVEILEEIHSRLEEENIELTSIAEIA